MAEESRRSGKPKEPSQRKLEKAAEDGKVLSPQRSLCIHLTVCQAFMLMFITPMFMPRSWLG